MDHFALSDRVARRQVLAGLTSLSLVGASARARAAEDTAAPARPLAERLAAYAHDLSYADLDAATVERVKAHVIDTLGCGMAALDERPVRICRDVALAGGGGRATVIGTRERTSPDLAAFANGAACRYYDLNDAYVGRLSSHPSDHIAPCLAVAEAQGASAHDLVTAIALAYEINCRFVDAFDLTTRGWDSPVFSLPAVALAAGKLMQLTREQLTEAVNLAINDHIAMAQTRVQTLSDWKGLADAEASRNAVFAALLAGRGLTGPSPIFEGRLGFFKQVSGEAAMDVGAFGGRGHAFRIHQCGMKAYPAVIYCQTAIVAAKAVGDEVAKGANGIGRSQALGRIAAVEIATSKRGLQQTGSEPEKWAPATRDTADHSMPYIVARAMFEGDITNATYAPAKLKDPAILSFMRKITVDEDPVLTARVGPSVPTRVTAILAGGERVSREIDDVPGFPGKPMTRADIERKFRGNIGSRWSKDETDRRLEALWRLDETRDLGALLQSFAA